MLHDVWDLTENWTPGHWCLLMARSLMSLTLCRDDGWPLLVVWASSQHSGVAPQGKKSRQQLYPFHGLASQVIAFQPVLCWSEQPQTHSDSEGGETDLSTW